MTDVSGIHAGDADNDTSPIASRAEDAVPVHALERRLLIAATALYICQGEGRREREDLKRVLHEYGLVSL